MARLPIFRALDSNGDPVNAATQGVFENRTTTPVDTFTDPELTIAHLPAVVADAAGAWAAIYAPSGTYTVELKDPEGNHLPGSPFNDIVALSGTLQATFDSQADVEAANIDTGVGAIHILAFDSDPGGSGIYDRVATEPGHAAKIQSGDGAWWELADPMVSVKIFNAAGDGTTNDTAAFNSAIAAATAQDKPVAIPPGRYLLDPLDPLVEDRTGAAPRHHVRLCGSDIESTVLLYNGDLANPLMRFNPTSTVKLGIATLRGFTIDGQGNQGKAILASHMSNSTFSQLELRDIEDFGFDFEEFWDSHFEDIEFNNVGDLARTRPAIRLSNRDAADSNTSCNNLTFFDIQAENCPYRVAELYETCKRISFKYLKCHSNPDDLPAGIEHVVIDGRNAAGGMPDDNRFEDCAFPVGGGTGIRITNTGGSSGTGPLRTRIVNTHFEGLGQDGGVTTAHFGVDFDMCVGAFVSATTVTCDGNFAWGFRCNDDALGVCIDWDSTSVFDGFPVGYGGTGYAADPQLTAEIQGGIVTAVPGVMTVDAEGRTGSTDDLDTLLPSDAATSQYMHGKTVTLMAADDTRTVVVKHNTGNIRLNGGADRSLTSSQDTLTLRYNDQAPSPRWYEVAFSDNAT